MHSALLPALCSTEALFGMSTQSNKAGVGQSKSRQEALGQITSGQLVLEDPQAQGKVEIRVAAAPEGGLEGPWACGAGLPSNLESTMALGHKSHR